jgi:deazaflavin-dependent oxidoreductase (nitroreductase family)
MARFNVHVTNRVTLPIAGQVPGLAIVINTGRKSGRTYRTPVLVFGSADEYVVALAYGRDAQWVQNVLAAGGCQLVARGREVRLIQPEIVHDPGRTAVPLPLRWVLEPLRVEDFLHLHLAEGIDV